MGSFNPVFFRGVVMLSRELLLSLNEVFLVSSKVASRLAMTCLMPFLEVTGRLLPIIEEL